MDYPEIDSEILPGVQDNGVIIFEPLDPTADQTEFRFEANKGFTEDSEFIFNVGTIGEGAVGQEQEEELGGEDEVDGQNGEGDEEVNIFN